MAITCEDLYCQCDSMYINYDRDLSLEGRLIDTRQRI